ncbi:MAG: ATP synthase F1 subunit gamma [Ignavibacteriae bacterium]|nr:ATP synthase F1 subunit gamma [Ignavibacteriota bacterium]
MATLRDIRRRIGAVKSTQKITKAMKMVAAAKLRRAQDAMIAARPYAKTMKQILQHLSSKVDVTTNQFFEEREVKNVALVVVTSDRGLCGSFNANLIKAAVAHINKNYKDLNEAGHLKLICIGKKGYDFFSKRNYKIIEKHTGLFSALNFQQAKTIVGEILDGYSSVDKSGQSKEPAFDKVEIIYNEFKSIAQPRISIEQYLPIVPETTSHISHLTSHIDYIYEPSSKEIMDALLPKHLNFQIWRVLLESNAAEQGARMAAMDNATTNASDMIRVLQLSYNKARQASITKELLEIVGGAEALKKAS